MALGKILREARERRQLTLSQVATSTRMKVQVAQALEAEDYRKIPAPIYGRGFIRMYAEFIGVDPKPLVAEYMAAVSAPVEPPVAPAQASGEKKSPAAAPPGQTVPARRSLTKMTPVPRQPVQTRPTPVKPERPPAPVPEPPPAVAAAQEPLPEPPAPVPEPPPPLPPPPPPPVEPEPQPVAEVQPAESPKPESPPGESGVDAIPSPVAPKPEDELFAWGQTVATVAPPPVEQPPPPQPEPEPEPIQSPAPVVQQPQEDVAPVAFVETTFEKPVPQTEPVPMSPELVSRPTDSNDLFASAVSAPLARPPKTTLGPQPATYARRPPHRPEPGKEPRLSSEREALKWRAALVGVGVVIVTLLLISSLSRCSAPPKEMKRGPVKEQLKMAVEPPHPYVD